MILERVQFESEREHLVQAAQELTELQSDAFPTEAPDPWQDFPEVQLTVPEETLWPPPGLRECSTAEVRVEHQEADLGLRSVAESQQTGTLKFAAPPGATVLHVTDEENYQVGNQILLFGTHGYEVRVVVHLASLRVDRPLEFAYPAGATTIRVPAPPSKEPPPLELCT